MRFVGERFSAVNDWCFETRTVHARVKHVITFSASSSSTGTGKSSTGGGGSKSKNLHIFRGRHGRPTSRDVADVTRSNLASNPVELSNTMWRGCPRQTASVRVSTFRFQEQHTDGGIVWTGVLDSSGS